MVVKAVGQFSLIHPGDRVLCALSGGSDSICLTHRLAPLAKKQGFTLAAAHFSHGLRPESAEDERRLCQRLCDSLEIPLFCGAGDTVQYAAEHGMGLEEAARNLRRAFLEQTADRWQATSIATGHHLEDSAETLLFNLIRGTGGQGLQGIPPRRGRYIRPLILSSKEEILAYLAEHQLEYADDPTNFTGDNARAVMRRQVFPALEQLNGAAARHLAQTALDNWQKDEAIRTEADELVSAATCTVESVHIPVTALLNAAPEAAVRALQILQRKAGGHMLERPHVDALFALCRGENPSAQTHLPGTKAFRRYDSLVITGQPAQRLPKALTLLPGETGCFGDWEIHYVSGPEPLTVRSRQTGDTISMVYGRKSVKKLLIERKIPKDLRDTVPILCNNETILAVGDLCVAQLPGEKKFYIVCRRKEI